MMTSPTTSSLTSAELKQSLQIIEVKPGLKFSLSALQHMLPDTETVLFFGKVYELNHKQLSYILSVTHQTPLADALFNQGHAHSSDLQDYVVDMLDFVPDMQAGDVTFSPHVVKGEILPQVWESLEIEIADSIKTVAARLESVVDKMPGKTGEMLFKSMAVLNSKRPTIGDYRATIHHARQKPNLVILDVSGSMSESTIRTIVDDVVALSYKANASLAIVSNTCTYWEPGSYDSDSVLNAAEFGGTHYEELAPLFDQDWGVVVTIADYDSSYDSKAVVSAKPGRIDQVLDISLVDRPTFLAEVVGQLASEVKPLLVANDYLC